MMEETLGEASSSMSAFRSSSCLTPPTAWSSGVGVGTWGDELWLLVWMEVLEPVMESALHISSQGDLIHKYFIMACNFTEWLTLDAGMCKGISNSKAALGQMCL